MEGHGWLISTFSSGNFWNQRQLRSVCEGITVKERLWVLMDLNQIQLPLTGFVMAVHPPEPESPQARNVTTAIYLTGSCET